MGVAKSQRREPSAKPQVARRSRSSSSGVRHSGRVNGSSQSLKSTNPLKFTISSDPAHHEQRRVAQEQILQRVHECGYDEQSTFAIKISMDEALTNAIKHGNKHDPTKHVHVEARISPKRAEIMIEDEGPGFARSHVPDPTAEENLCKCSGRGILLMETYMNSVKWTKHGRRVKMVRVNQRHFGEKG
jgi:serine/threonine-protein kinase RsbW